MRAIAPEIGRRKAGKVSERHIGVRIMVVAGAVAAIEFQAHLLGFVARRETTVAVKGCERILSKRAAAAGQDEQNGKNSDAVFHRVPPFIRILELGRTSYAC